MCKHLVVALLVLGACGGKGDEKPASEPAATTPEVFDPKGVELAQLGGKGALPMRPGLLVLIASPNAVVLDGTPILAVHDGTVDDREREGGAGGRKLTKVTAYLAARAKAEPTPGDVLGIAIDRRLTYGLLFDLIYSAKSEPAAWKKFAVLARARDTSIVTLPLVLPDRAAPIKDSRGPGTDLARQIAEAPASPSRMDEPPLKLVLSISDKELLVWSISGLEGTLRDPRLRVPHSDPSALAKVGEVLADVAKRRWYGKQRDAGTREIILMAEQTTPMQLVAEAMATVRATPTGEELFPDILLSLGFEASDAPVQRADLPTSPQDTIAALEGGTVSSQTATSAPKGRVAIAQKQTFDDTSLTPDVVLAKIQSAYVAGIKRCYRTYLMKDPSARGKLDLSFTVTERGRTAAGKVRGFAAGVDECIEPLIKNWVFPTPKDKDEEPTEASFTIQLQLTPD